MNFVEQPASYGVAGVSGIWLAQARGMAEQPVADRGALEEKIDSTNDVTSLESDVAMLKKAVHSLQKDIAVIRSGIAVLLNRRPL